MAADLITTANLLLAINGGNEELRRLAGDDGTGSYRTDRVAYAITVASEQAYGLLMAGFSTVANVQALAANDVAVRHAIAMIVREVLAEGKEQFRLPDGKTVFSDDARRARDVLRGKSTGAPRTSAEEVSPGPGQSTLLRPRASSGPKPSVFTDCNGKLVGF